MIGKQKSQVWKAKAQYMKVRVKGRAGKTQTILGFGSEGQGSKVKRK
jgi:hypothetical protein